MKCLDRWSLFHHVCIVNCMRYLIRYQSSYVEVLNNILLNQNVMADKSKKVKRGVKKAADKVEESRKKDEKKFREEEKDFIGKIARCSN